MERAIASRHRTDGQLTQPHDLLQPRETVSRASDLIELLGLEPHPEGGYYREVFRSGARVVTQDERGPCAALTTILFLLERNRHSRWHRVLSDEVWHLYEGGPLELLELDLDCNEFNRPGFEFADFTMLADEPESAALVREHWPDLADLI